MLESARATHHRSYLALVLFADAIKLFKYSVKDRLPYLLSTSLFLSIVSHELVENAVLSLSLDI